MDKTIVVSVEMRSSPQVQARGKSNKKFYAHDEQNFGNVWRPGSHPREPSVEQVESVGRSKRSFARSTLTQLADASRRSKRRRSFKRRFGLHDSLRRVTLWWFGFLREAGREDDVRSNENDPRRSR